MQISFSLPLHLPSSHSSTLATSAEAPLSPNTLFLSALTSSMLVTPSNRLVQGYPIALLDDDIFPIDEIELQQRSPTYFPPSPCSAHFPAATADRLLSPVLEEDEDLLASFPEYDREELRKALRESGLGRAEDRFVVDEAESEVVCEKAGSGKEGKKAVSFAPSPVKKQRPAALTIPRRLARPWTPLPSPSKLSPLPSPLSAAPSSSSSQGSSPASANFSSSDSSSLLSVPTTAPSSSGKPSPASSNASSPQAHSFPSTRASSVSGMSTAASSGPALSRCTTRTTQTTSSTRSSFSGKSTRRSLKHLFSTSPTFSPSASSVSSHAAGVPSAPPLPPVLNSSSRLNTPFTSRHSSTVSLSPSLPAPPPAVITLTPSTLASLRLRLSSDPSLVSPSGKDSREAKELKKELRLEKEERRERERVGEEREEREWRERRERRQRSA